MIIFQKRTRVIGTFFNFDNYKHFIFIENIEAKRIYCISSSDEDNSSTPKARLEIHLNYTKIL